MPEIVTLSDPNGRLRIEYSRQTLQQIRERAIDGLLALPRIGMGAGGLLLGSRQGGVVTLLNSIEIPCSHSAGPSFNLTQAEKNHVAELIAGLGAAGVIGWYCSKTRGTALMGEPEIALYRELCPGPEQIALVIKPSTVVPVRAAFFFRDGKGQVVKAVEWDLDEWQPPEEEAAKEKPAAAVMAAAAMAEPAPQPAPAKLVEVPAVSPAPAPPPAAPQVSEIPRPLRAAPAAPVPVRTPRLSGWILALAACLALAAAAFLTQNTWLPRPPLTLGSNVSDGKLAIRWNAEAFRGIDHASLSINDGGNLQSVPLDRFELNQGVYIYAPKSQRVTARLSSGDMSAITVWFAPEPKQPSPPVAADPASPPPAQAPKPAAHEPVYDDR